MPPKSYIPHAFLGGELTAFFDECNRWVKSAKTPDKQFRALQSSVIFRLLYSSGIRTTEVRLLRVIDVNLQEGVLNIRKTKASIEHYVALHDSATQMLGEYDVIAQKFFPGRELFFPNNGKEPYRADTLTYDFRKIWDRVNNENAVPYDLRTIMQPTTLIHGLMQAMILMTSSSTLVRAWGIHHWKAQCTTTHLFPSWLQYYRTKPKQVSIK